MKSLIVKSLSLVYATTLVLTGCSTMQNKNDISDADKNPTDFPPLPEGITSFGAATDDGYLYIFGGYTGKRHDYSLEKVRGTFYRINLADDGKNQAWEKLPSAEPAQGTAIVAHGNYIYRIGGMAAKNHDGEEQNLFSQNYFERYDIAKKIWEPLAPLPDGGRSTHDAIVIGDKLYVGGGWDLNGDDPLGNGKDATKWHGTLLVADLSQKNPQWQSIQQPFQRRAIAMAAIGSKIYFIGGMDASNNTSRAADIFDTATGVWSKGPDLPHGIMNGFGFAAISDGKKIYASGFSGKLLSLSENGTEWQVVEELDQWRIFHRLILLPNNHLLIIGGEGKSGKLNDGEIMTISK